MKRAYIELNKSSYQNIKDFLLHDSSEHAVFLLAKPTNKMTKVIFKIQDYYLVPDKEVDNSSYDLRLKDDAQAKIIKWAWDNQACLIEIHSHPFSKRLVSFSSYDLDGFKEFVPYVWWRLERKSYIAMVLGQTNYDALVWIDNPNTPQRLEGIMVDSKFIKPINGDKYYL